MDAGIIGGPDGPTVIFISSDAGSYITAAIVLICIALIIFAILKIRKRKRKAG